LDAKFSLAECPLCILVEKADTMIEAGQCPGNLIPARPDDPISQMLPMSKPYLDAAYRARQQGAAFNLKRFIDPCWLAAMCMAEDQTLRARETALMNCFRADQGGRAPLSLEVV
jgi:hypothetical protein